MFRKLLTWISGPLMAAFFLWLCFRGVSLADVWEQLKGANASLLLLSIATVPLHLLTRAWRWRTLLGPAGKSVRFIELLSAVSIGYMSSLLPGRVGEVLRPALLSRRTGLPFAPTLATVGVERVILDLMAVLLSGALALVLPVSYSGLGAGADVALLGKMRTLGEFSLVGGLVALVLTSFLARKRIVIQASLEARARRSHFRVYRAALSWFAGLFPGLVAFATLRGIVRLAAETAVIWSIIGIGIQWGIRACGVNLAPGAWLIMLPILAVGIGIPTPGGTGTYHLAMKLGLVNLFAAGESAALGAGLVVHAIAWIPVLIMGGYFIARGGLSRSGEGSGEVPEDAAPEFSR